MISADRFAIRGARPSPARRLGAILTVLVVSVALTGALAQGSERAAVQVRIDPVVGAHLVTSDGLTLYARNSRGAACEGPCMRPWTPYEGQGMAVALPGGVAGRLERGAPGSATTAQLAYDGRPLFLFAADGAPGQLGGYEGPDGAWTIVNAVPTVRVQNHPALGDILVGPTGMTLYVFDNDAGNEIVCDDGCSENWPPLVVVEPPLVPPGLPGRIDVFGRSPDEYRPARSQVRYRGRPLYYWSRDVAPGDVTGIGIGGLWSVARP